MTRRILHIIGSLQQRGTARQVGLIAAGLPPDEFEVLVAVVDSSVIGRRWSIDPPALLRLQRMIAGLQPDLVHTWGDLANSYGRLAALLAGVKRLVASEQQIDPSRMDAGRLLERWLDRRTDRIIANSQSVYQCCADRSEVAAPLTLIPDAAAGPPPGGVSRDEVLARFGLPRDARLVLAAGPLVPRQRLKELIWAMDQLKAVGAPAHLLVVGTGRQRQQLERYARLNQIAQRVHFLGDRDDLAEWLPQVDVVWHAGVSEGAPGIVLEAMAAGLPVVMAQARRFPQTLVTHGKTGFLVPLRERAGFARWTLPLLENPELAAQIAAAGRDFVLEFYRADRIVPQYAGLYRELLAGNPGGSRRNDSPAAPLAASL